MRETCEEPYAPSLWSSTIAKMRVHSGGSVTKVVAFLQKSLREEPAQFNSKAWVAPERSPEIGEKKRKVRAFGDALVQMITNKKAEPDHGSGIMYVDRVAVARWDRAARAMRATAAWDDVCGEMAFDAVQSAANNANAKW